MKICSSCDKSAISCLCKDVEFVRKAVAWMRANSHCSPSFQRERILKLLRKASDPKGADSGSELATSVSSPESAAASLSAGVKDQDFQKFFERIDAAIKRITSGQAAMRIPVDFTDPDVVLAECKLSIAALRERITQLEKALEEKDAKDQR